MHQCAQACTQKRTNVRQSLIGRTCMHKHVKCNCENVQLIHTCTTICTHTHTHTHIHTGTHAHTHTRTYTLTPLTHPWHPHIHSHQANDLAAQLETPSDPMEVTPAPSNSMAAAEVGGIGAQTTRAQTFDRLLQVLHEARAQARTAMKGKCIQLFVCVVYVCVALCLVERVCVCVCVPCPHLSVPHVIACTLGTRNNEGRAPACKHICLCVCMCMGAYVVSAAYCKFHA